MESQAERLDLLDEARRRHQVSWDQLWECLAAHEATGRQGLGRFRELLTQRGGGAPPDSVFVRRLATLLDDAGFPEPVFDHPVPGLPYRVDLAWPNRRVAVECDGGTAHGHEAAGEADPRRRNQIRLAGWLLLEVTWKRMARDPASVVGEVRRALEASALGH